MKVLILTAAAFLSSQFAAASISQVDDVTQVAGQYAVAPSQLLAPADVKAADADKGVVKGPERIVPVQGEKNLFFLYGSRIVYLKKQPADKVARAFEMTSELPVPPPVEKVWNIKKNSVAANHELTTYDVRASQSKLVVKVTTNCKGATHAVVVSEAERIVQNKWENCVDAEDANKQWYPNGWQSNRVYDLGGGVTAVLIHNMMVIRRHKIGFITPSEEQIFEMAMKASEDTLAGYLKRLK
ncbi:MAG TPA: hypothetical protein VFV50_12060 [Bdellovibrionales bacterium]|nr:hypothetical protein [Bdellovibrionales bacterium]